MFALAADRLFESLALHVEWSSDPTWFQYAHRPSRAYRQTFTFSSRRRDKAIDDSGIADTLLQEAGEIELGR